MHTNTYMIDDCVEHALTIDFIAYDDVYDGAIGFLDAWEPTPWRVRGQLEPRHVRTIEAACGLLY